MNVAASETFISTMVDRIVRGFQPSRVVLFGSHARGTATEWSDVDLLVILPNVSDKRHTAIEIRRALGDLPVCQDISNSNSRRSGSPRTPCRNRVAFSTPRRESCRTREIPHTARLTNTSEE